MATPTIGTSSGIRERENLSHVAQKWIVADIVFAIATILVIQPISRNFAAVGKRL